MFVPRLARAVPAVLRARVAALSAAHPHVRVKQVGHDKHSDESKSVEVVVKGELRPRKRAVYSYPPPEDGKRPFYGGGEEIES